MFFVRCQKSETGAFYTHFYMVKAVEYGNEHPENLRRKKHPTENAFPGEDSTFYAYTSVSFITFFINLLWSALALNF